MSTPDTTKPSSDVTTTETMRLHCLHAVRILGFASPAAVAGFTRLDPDAVGAELTAATEAGLCVYRDGRLSGYALTPAGRTVHAAAVSDELERHGGRAAVEAGDERFVELNGPFKQMCSDWQLRDGTPNDHGDADYDGRLIRQLEVTHEAAVRLTGDLADAVPRFGWYPPRFEAAWLRVSSGDPRAFTAPMADSYHDTWMALHQDLMSTLGRQRAATDGH